MPICLRSSWESSAMGAASARYGGLCRTAAPAARVPALVERASHYYPDRASGAQNHRKATFRYCALRVSVFSSRNRTEPSPIEEVSPANRTLPLSGTPRTRFRQI